MAPGCFVAERIPRGVVALAATVGALLVGGCRSGFDRYAPVVRHPAVATLFAVRPDSRRLLGTGFFVRPDVLLTAHHVARAAAFDTPSEGPAARIEAELDDGTRVHVHGVRGGDSDGDLIALAADCPVEGVPPLILREAPVAVGEPVVTVGSPHGRAQTVGVGRVMTSALTGDPDWADRFRVSIPSAGGASGCPVLDAKGLVVGVAVRGSEGPDGGTMATPAPRALPLIDGDEIPWETWRASEVMSPPERAMKRLDQAGISAAEADRVATAHALHLYLSAASIGSRERVLLESYEGACDCLLRLGQRESAVSLLRTCRERHPGCAWAETLLGTYLDRCGDPEEGQRHLERARRLDPRDARAALRAGEALFRHDLSANALPALRDAVAIEPGWAYAWEILGSAATSARSVKEAEAAYRRLIDLRPDYARGLAAYAWLLLIQGRTVDARDAAEAAVRLDAKSLTAHEVLASVHLSTGDEAAARKEIDLVRALDPARGAMIDTGRARTPPR